MAAAAPWTRRVFRLWQGSGEGCCVVVKVCEGCLGHVVRLQGRTCAEQCPLVVLNEVGLDLRTLEGRVGCNVPEEVEVRPQAPNLKLGEGLPEFPEGEPAVLVPHHKLGYHRVVEHSHLVSLADASLDSEVGSRGGGGEEVDGATAGKEVLVRVLSVDAGLEGVAMLLDLTLPQWECLPRRYLELPLDEVDTGDHLGDRVLDLQAGVHLHEVEPLLGVHDELNSPCADVVHCLRCTHSRQANSFPHLWPEIRRWGLLDDLLVPSLHTAITFKEVHSIPVCVSKDLNFDVSGTDNIFLNKNMVIVERLHGFSSRRLKHAFKVFGPLHNAHTLATTSHDSLNQDGVSNLVSLSLQALVGLILTVISTYDRHTSVRHDDLRSTFGSH
eukprot:Colp12_sorted_trinity150504_noHs@19408